MHVQQHTSIRWAPPLTCFWHGDGLTLYCICVCVYRWRIIYTWRLNNKNMAITLPQRSRRWYKGSARCSSHVYHGFIRVPNAYVFCTYIGATLFRGNLHTLIILIGTLPTIPNSVISTMCSKTTVLARDFASCILLGFADSYCVLFAEAVNDIYCLGYRLLPGYYI